MSNTPVLAIIGGGASGLMAAVWAAKTAKELNKSIKTVIFEKNPRIGKKLLVTGNGRCNLSNSVMSPDNYYGSRLLFENAYSRFDRKALLDYFASAGMAVKTDHAGRIYPLSNQASGVLDTLRYEVAKAGAEVITDTKVTSLKRREDGFLINGSFYADRCILACGGKAGSVHGSDGSGYELLRPFHIEITDIFPALTALESAGFTKALKGIRAEGTITVKHSGKILHAASGEIQYTDYGISGIPAMQVSRCISELLYTGKTDAVTVYVDSVPSMSEKQLTEFLQNIKNNAPELPCEMLLAGLMPKRLGVFLLTEISVNPAKSVSTLYDAVLLKIVSACKAKKYRITSVRGFDDAQVTAGGVCESELDPFTLELKKQKGLYVCGELADVDGDCGGYNLQWAFSSGYAAGVSAAREI